MAGSSQLGQRTSLACSASCSASTFGEGQAKALGTKSDLPNVPEETLQT